MSDYTEMEMPITKTSSVTSGELKLHRLINLDAFTAELKMSIIQQQI